MNKILVIFSVLLSIFAMGLKANPVKESLETSANNKHQVDNLKSLVNTSQDATAAIQVLIDKAPKDGGLVVIPAGKYMINVDKGGISLRSGIHLQLSANATLVSEPATSSHYSMIRIYSAKDVTVTGGTLVGDRKYHQGSGGEWGMGIDIRASSNVTVSDISISNFWGDGIYVGTIPKNGVNLLSSNIDFENVTSTYNRRQGMSIVGGRDIRVTNSTFAFTSGTAPESGIDLEPNDNDSISNVEINHCDLHDNAGFGIVASNNKKLHGASISNISLLDNTVSNNKHYGIAMMGIISHGQVVGNHAVSNNRYDIYSTSDVSLDRMQNNTVSSGIKRIRLNATHF